MTRRDRGRRRRAPRSARPGPPRRAVAGWLFVLPALLMYALFVLQPLARRSSTRSIAGTASARRPGSAWRTTARSSTTPICSARSSTRSSSSCSSASSPCPRARRRQRDPPRRHRPAGAIARTVLFLPQVIPLVAAGIIWGWLLSLSGLVNQTLGAIGLDGITRAWLGDFDWALPAVGMIGVWVLLGFCTVLLLTGMSKIDHVVVRGG